MSGLRLLWRVAGITLACSISTLALAAEKLIGLVFRQGHIERENRIVRRWAGWMASVMKVRIRVEGKEPQAPFLLVANHLSYTDVVVLMSQLDARLLSKSEVKSWPVLGLLARFGGTLFIDRTNRRDIPRALTEIRETLTLGRGVVFFPEGTSSAGMEVLPFKASLFEVAVAGELEIVTAAISYSTPPTDRPAQWSVCWWGDMPFASHLIGMLKLSRIDAKLRFGEATIRAEERKQLAILAQTEVQRLFEPVCEEIGEDRPLTAT